MDTAVCEAEGRDAVRTNMFIGAAFVSDGISTTVRVRNLSTLGGQIETALAPSKGVPFKLRRGRLVATGTVVWSNGKRCGLRFDSGLSVRDWMALPSNAGQAQVDTMAAAVRSGGPSRASDVQFNDVNCRSDLLAQIYTLIEALGEELADDSAAVARHGATLQNIDQALQLLDRVRRSHP